jgi:hypothetical protein
MDNSLDQANAGLTKARLELQQAINQKARSASHEEAYGLAYRELVKRGAAVKLRGKYRKEI